MLTRQHAVFASPRTNLVKVTWETEGFNARPAKNAPSGSALALLVWSIEGDGCEREAALKRIWVQLRSWCKDIAVICLSADADSAEGTALRKCPSTVLNTARGHNFPR